MGVQHLRRDPATVAMLEEIQRAYTAEAPSEAPDKDFPQNTGDRADIETAARFPGRMTAQQLVVLTQSKRFRDAADKRKAELDRELARSDGDLWSKYERPDHRSRLIAVTDGVEAAIRRSGKAIDRRPVIGTLPTHDINAQAIPGPKGAGDIVAVETGLFMFTDTLARIAALALTIKWPLGHSIARDPDLIVAHLAMNKSILLDYADLVFCQTYLGTCQYTDKRALPTRSGLRKTHTRLLDAADTFVLAHEYAHVLLGHPSAGEAAAESDRRQRELTADALAFELTILAHHPSWALAGAMLFLAGLRTTDWASAVARTGEELVAPSPTHPTAGARVKALVDKAMATLQGRQLSRALSLAKAVDFLLGDLWFWLRAAFESAHRGGFPEEPLAVATYIDKQTYLYAFLRAAFDIPLPDVTPEAAQNPFALAERVRNETHDGLLLSYRRAHDLA